MHRRWVDLFALTEAGPIAGRVPGIFKPPSHVEATASDDRTTRILDRDPTTDFVHSFRLCFSVADTTVLPAASSHLPRTGALLRTDLKSSCRSSLAPPPFRSRRALPIPNLQLWLFTCRPRKAHLPQWACQRRPASWAFP